MAGGPHWPETSAIWILSPITKNKPKKTPNTSELDISISDLEEEHARILLRQKEMDKQAEIERKRKEEEHRRHGKYLPRREKTCLPGLRQSDI